MMDSVDFQGIGTPEMFFEINLEEIDPYSLCSFKELQYERFEQGLDLFIVVILGQRCVYLFEASRFIEDGIKSQWVNIKNPFTRENIDRFGIYFSSKDSPRFQFYMNKEEVMVSPNHLPILWNDHTRETYIRAQFLYAYAEPLQSKNIYKAIELYEKSAELGFQDALLALFDIYYNLKDKENCMKYADKWVDSMPIKHGVNNALYFINIIRKEFKDEALALFLHERLCRKTFNCIPLSLLIDKYEKGIEVERNLSLAREWRQRLPEGWQNAPMSEFRDHLLEIKYNFDRDSYP